MYEVSDWATNSEIQHQLTFLEIDPFEGSYYISFIFQILFYITQF